MADLLPSIPDVSASEDAEPRVVGVGEAAADEVFAALSSSTARELYATLAEDPAHPSALAERVDTSLQNAQYHLEKLEAADLVEVVDTAYSEKGREMDVYAPADAPLVVFAGDEDDQSLLRQALGRLLGGLGVLSGASVVAEGLFGDETATDRSRFLLGGDDAGAYDGADEAADAPPADEEEADVDVEMADDADAWRSADPDDTAIDAVGTVADDLAWVGDLLAATGLSPGIAVLVVGGTVLALGVTGWYAWMRQTRA